MGHPYAPPELELPGFVPLKLSQAEILVSYLGASLFVLLAVWLVSGRCGRLSKTDRLLMCWWAFTGLTHIMIEGPFVFTPDFFKKENPNFFDEVWKEYSKGDSRYVARDAATVTVEGITAVLEGPASLLAVEQRAVTSVCSVVAARLAAGRAFRQHGDDGGLRYCIPEVLQPYSPVHRLSGSALRMLGLLYHRILGWLQLLGRSILLLGIFHWRKQFLDLDTDAHCHKILEENMRSISS
ncbi:probable 3-beta-hydroxysteroid-Delta(8),Delta(7)-isomerase isoform X1 [Miscanthus floridulus]|uniref:probable 3-beta-hydroxysteroid-Delta(8),Delta(7)-isomerase isoform X1 n=1 Tax=Miscanthus floridulus TaxID=154761 RepID=UPI00345AB0D7